MRKILYLLPLLLLCGKMHAQICATANEPVTINSTWSERGCAAQSAGAGTGSVVLCASAVSPTCQGWKLPFVHDVAVNTGDTVTSFCDEDGTVTGAYIINVIDNALGSGTVTTANSGGNTNVTGVSGTSFASGWVGGNMMIGATPYPIITFTDATHIVVSGNAGANTAKPYFAGNLFTKMPQTDFDFLNTNSGTNRVKGNEFYLLGSAYAVASGYNVECVFANTTGSVADMDTSFTVFRETSGLASLGIQDSSSWTQSTSSASSTTCGASGTCFLEGTTNSISASANNLILGFQQQSNATKLGTFNVGSLIGVDNDGTSVLSGTFGGYYYTAASSTALAGAIAATFYSSNPSDGFAIASMAIKSSTASSPPPGQFPRTN